MKTMLRVLALCAVVVVSACATPEVVQVRQPGDQQLTCDQLRAGIEEANRFEAEARSDRGVTGTNVAAAVLFWPALAGTYVNTEEAIDAATARRDHLSAIADQKNCNF